MFARPEVTRLPAALMTDETFDEMVPTALLTEFLRLCREGSDACRFEMASLTFCTTPSTILDMLEKAFFTPSMPLFTALMRGWKTLELK